MTTFPIPTLETDRLILRGAKFEDFEPLSTFYASDRSKFVKNIDMTPDKCWRTLAHIAGHWMLRGYGLFVLTLKGNDAPLGVAGAFHPIEWPERELGWSLWSAEHEGHGYVTEAAIAFRYYFYNVQKWNTAVSYIHPDNTTSINVAERLGCTIDKTAQTPDDEPCLVYRHPARGALA
ncbi:MAG: GNAT family N-acetyltransferase [Marinosulfonomonas sp.]|nr:GNAT family N-acetyltransferase [Marinosulfonomonas sp.]